VQERDRTVSSMVKISTVHLKGVNHLKIEFKGPVFDSKVKKALHTKLVHFFQKDDGINSTNKIPLPSVECLSFDVKHEQDLWTGNTFQIPFHRTFAFRQLLFQYFKLDPWYQFADVDTSFSVERKKCTMTWERSRSQSTTQSILKN